MAVKRALLTFLVFIMLLPVAGVMAKEVYMWRDKNGVVVFSDVKKPGAKKISLTEDKATTIQQANNTLIESNDAEKALNYGIKIVSPSHNETIRDNTGSLHVSTRITPTFNPKYKIQLLFNGKRKSVPQTGAVFVVRNVSKGAHTLQGQLFDETNKAIATSKQITFVMHRTGDLAN